MCTEANTRLSSAEIVSSGNVSSGSRDTRRFNSVLRETSKVQCLPASNIWERSYNVDTQQGSICPVVHCVARATWRLVRLSFLPKSRHGKSREEAHFCGQEALSPRETSATQSCHRQEVGEADQHSWSHTSFARDLTIQRQASQPSCTSRSSFHQVAKLVSHHGMIPTWHNLFQVGMCLRSPEPASAAILLLQWAANSVAAVAPATISKFLSAVRECVSQRPTEQGCRSSISATTVNVSVRWMTLVMLAGYR